MAYEKTKAAMDEYVSAYKWNDPDLSRIRRAIYEAFHEESDLPNAAAYNKHKDAGPYEDPTSKWGPTVSFSRAYDKTLSDLSYEVRAAFADECGGAYTRMDCIRMSVEQVEGKSVGRRLRSVDTGE
jgi:hypothetical protein